MFSVLVIWMLGTFQSLFLSATVQVSGPGCVIIVEVFLGNPCVAWKVGCLEKGTGTIFMTLAIFGLLWCHSHK